MSVEDRNISIGIKMLKMENNAQDLREDGKRNRGKSSHCIGEKNHFERKRRDGKLIPVNEKWLLFWRK